MKEPDQQFLREIVNVKMGKVFKELVERRNTNLKQFGIEGTMTVWPSYDGAKNPATGLDDVITEYMIRKRNGLAFQGMRYKVHETT